MHWSKTDKREETLAKMKAKLKGRKVWNAGKKGVQVGPNKGKKFSEEWRQHLSEAHEGQIPHNKGGTNHWMVGVKNPRWKDGATEKNRLARRTPEYREWRMRVLVRDNFVCQLCGAQNAHVADHIKSFADHPDLRTDLSNGRTLCFDCHKKTPSYLKS